MLKRLAALWQNERRDPEAPELAKLVSTSKSVSGSVGFEGRRYHVSDGTPGERVELVLGPAELEVYSLIDGRRIARHERGRPARVLPDPTENSMSLAKVLGALPDPEVHRRPLPVYQELIDG